MIPNPDTFARIREQAKAYAVSVADGPAKIGLRLMIRRAYLAGANAGYTAALAERREK